MNLFFKLVNYTTYRNRLFTIFQLCIQVRGFDFPNKFAKDWIMDENERIDLQTKRIDEGLKLGIFLGDAGWLNESALVLSHTFQLSSKWVCDDQHLKLTKTIQLLAKWLIVTTNYHNFIEAKVVLEHLKKTIQIFEKIGTLKLCLANMFVSISQYHFVRMEFHESWLWAVKSVNQISVQSCDNLKLSVISHAMKVCSVTNKSNMAKKLISQLHKFNTPINQNIYVNMLLNESYYFNNADLPINNFQHFFIALDLRRNLFGFYNFNTALVYVQYAYTRYLGNEQTGDFDEAACSIRLALHIMNKIGIPDDNMAFADAGRIKALISQEKYFYLRQFQNNNFNYELNISERLHIKTLNISLRILGENAMLTAKSYCCLGRHYESEENYTKSEEMHLNAIRIKELILGKRHTEVAMCLGHLASLYTYKLRRFKEAENLFLRAEKIFTTTYSHPFSGVLYNLKGLEFIYSELKCPEKQLLCEIKIRRFNEARMVWIFEQIGPNNNNSTNEVFDMDTVKCILNDRL